MTNADVAAWKALVAASEPIPLDLSRGHELHIAETKIADGGVTVFNWQAFCHCNWSQRWPTRDRRIAVAAHAKHVAGVCQP